ncbi:MAG: RIP metalloprotease RseP [Burkholderiales bacterium]|nr:MAG: RIP metalloprotease RseP [Burkholderiales bacterium]
MSTLQTLVAFLAALTLLIFVHELGHYLVARWCDVKVLRFSIGFGKPLVSWRVGPDRTEWTIAAIPLGGYVRMLDERDTSSGSIPSGELPRAFTRKTLTQRSAIVVAGPLANFLLAIAIYAGMGWVGTQEPAPVIDQPAPGTPAAAAQLQGGDRVTDVDGTSVRSWNDVRLRLLEPVIERRQSALRIERGGAASQVSIDASGLPRDEAERDFLRTLGLRLAPGKVVIANLVGGGAAERDGLRPGDELLSIAGGAVRRAADVIERVQVSAGTPLAFTVLRDGAEVTMTVTPDAVASSEAGERARSIGRIGAALQDRILMETVRYGPLESVGQGVRQTWEMSLFSLRMLGKMLMGDLSLRNLSGPVTIADLAGQSVRVGWLAYASFLALISISLGVLNLLPIPVLDGGHLVYYALEAARGRPLSERFMAITQKAGLAIILMMMALALFNDIIRLIGS